MFGSTAESYLGAMLENGHPHWDRDKMAAIFEPTFSTAFFSSENIWISIKISLGFVPKGPINNIPALVQIMAWRRSGDEPYSELMTA